MQIDRAKPALFAPARLAAIVLVALAAAILYRRFADVGLVGWDTYPLIASSRIRDWSDLLHVTSTPMLGRESGGIYYRPLPKLSLALDHALWGLDPRGYHVSDVLVFAAAALALYGLATALLGPRGRPGAMAALVFFLLHPVHATVVPAPSRRADVMCLLFMCLCLAAVARAVRRRGSGAGTPATTAAAAALAGGLALLSKETAFVLPPLAWLTAFLAGDERGNELGWARRALTATLVVAPFLAVTAVLIFARVEILGGIVGARPMRDATSLGALLGAFFEMGGRVVEGVLSGPAIVGAGKPPIAIASLLLVAAGLILLRAMRSRDDATAAAAAQTTVIACLWMVALVATYTLGLILQPWYLLNVSAALSLLVGAVFATLLELARVSPGKRVAAGLAIAALLLSCGRIAVYSPLLRPYDEWQRATTIENAHLEALQRRLEAAPAGTVLREPLLPMLLPRAGNDRQLVGVALIANYSIQAWAELTMPQRRIRVAYGRSADATVDPDGVVLVLGGPASGSIGDGRHQGM